MTSEILKSCPFCGGEASVQTTYGYSVSEAFCLDCGAHTGYPPGGCTESEAVEAWNTRAERTCKRFWTGAEMICSSCAHQLNDATANYCPNCGARVIGMDVGE